MKRNFIFLILVAVLIIILPQGTATFAQPQEPESILRYVINISAMSGGDYRLTCVNGQEQESILARGGNYRLTSIAAPALTGNGCCCTYLPFIVH